MVVDNYIPERGDAVWLQFNPQSGHEQAGHRPAVVLSPSSYNGRVGLAIFCPITNKVKGYPFEVRIPDELSVSGAVLADQIKSLDWRARNVAFICKLPSEVMKEIIQKLAAILNVYT
ncbi:MAG: endoribonuclease MazF [Caldilineaceae bacterium]|nr:endoribonuclease MazF [Caldilineaceae bacterium]